MIYCDIGNTCIKFMKDEKISWLSTNAINDSNLEITLLDISKETEQVVICSVVPEATLKIKHFIKQNFPSIKVVEIQAQDFKLKIDTETPQSVGMDLLALGSFVASKVNEGIIVNFGTATTITYVNDKTFKGTIILPGILMQKDSFAIATAKISKIELIQPKNNIGRSTKESISIGIISGQVEAVKGLVKNISENIKVFYSGGNSIFVKGQLPANWEYIEQATLKGLQITNKK